MSVSQQVWRNLAATA